VDNQRLQVVKEAHNVVRDAVMRPPKRVLREWIGEAYEVAKGGRFGLRDEVIILEKPAHSSLSKLVIIEVSKLVGDGLRDALLAANQLAVNRDFELLGWSFARLVDLMELKVARGSRDSLCCLEDPTTSIGSFYVVTAVANPEDEVRIAASDDAIAMAIDPAFLELVGCERLHVLCQPSTSVHRVHVNCISHVTSSSLAYSSWLCI
jgi:hypothetical protein